jgi:hypothetical protein
VSEPKSLSFEQVLKIHYHAIARFGYEAMIAIAERRTTRPELAVLFRELFQK